MSTAALLSRYSGTTELVSDLPAGARSTTFGQVDNTHLSLFSYLSFTGLSSVLVSAVTKLARSGQWFLSYSLGNFRGFCSQRYFGGKTGIFIQIISLNQ